MSDRTMSANVRPAERRPAPATAVPSPPVSSPPAPSPSLPFVFPGDAEAVIYRPARSAMTSGKANSRRWTLRFERRSPPFADPLMGWTGGADPLTQVELWFDTAEEAIAYARRQGFRFTVRGAETAPAAQVHASAGARRGEPLRLASASPWQDRIARPRPADRSRRPGDVLRDCGLSIEQKREILRRWALDAYRAEAAAAAGGEAPREESVRLDEVIDAIIDLEGCADSVPLARGARRRPTDEAERARAA